MGPPATLTRVDARVVLDTNTLISAMLFSGVASRLLPLWQSRRLEVLVSKPILQEYVRVLAYPKFGLDADEIRGLIEEELLPFVSTVRVRRRLRVVERDPDDDKFLECAVAGRAKYVVTGDQDLLVLRSYRGISVVNAATILEAIDPREE